MASNMKSFYVLFIPESRLDAGTVDCMSVIDSFLHDGDFNSAENEMLRHRAGYLAKYGHGAIIIVQSNGKRNWL